MRSIRLLARQLYVREGKLMAQLLVKLMALPIISAKHHGYFLHWASHMSEKT